MGVWSSTGLKGSKIGPKSGALKNLILSTLGWMKALFLVARKYKWNQLNPKWLGKYLSLVAGSKEERGQVLECSGGLVRCRPQDYTGQASAYTVHNIQYTTTNNTFLYNVYYTLPHLHTVQYKSHTGHCTAQSFDTEPFIHCFALQHILQP